nr:MAG TPA: hypothetical protein [Caudoviricetes sp.]
MNIVTKVRQTMKTLISATKNLKIGRDADVFSEIAFDFNMNKIDFNGRKSGTFNIQYLVSPKPESGNTAPSITYDEIISNFDEMKSSTFKDAGLIILGFNYEQSDIITDPTDGTVSLTFTINIEVTERKR